MIHAKFPAAALPRLARMTGAVGLLVSELGPDGDASLSDIEAQLAAYKADGPLDELSAFYRSALANGCKACGLKLDDHGLADLKCCYETKKL